MQNDDDDDGDNVAKTQRVGIEDERISPTGMAGTPRSELSPVALAELAYEALGRGELVDAERLFRVALERSPHAPGPLRGLSHALARQGRAEEALRAAESAGMDRNAFSDQVHYGYLLGAAGLPEQAEAAFKRALEIESSDASVHHALSHLFARRDRINEALEAAEHAAQLAPDERAYAAHCEHLRSRIEVTAGCKGQETGAGGTSIGSVSDLTADAARVAHADKSRPHSAKAETELETAPVVEPPAAQTDDSATPPPLPEQPTARKSGGWMSFLGW